MPTEITEITFRSSSNIFINAGIVGLYKFIQKYKIAYTDKFSSLDFSTLEKNELTIHCDELIEFLEEVYYFMGRSIYDISSENQIKKSDKYYFIKEPFTYKPFAKMTSYGLSGFVTKAPFGPQPIPRKEENAVFFKNLFVTDKDFANKIAQVYREKGLSIKGFEILENDVIENKEVKKGDSRIFLNEPYTKTPKLEFSEDFLLSGEELCPLTNEKFKKLISSKGCLPFTSSIENFNTFLSSDDQLKISFKARYLALFAPSICLYTYQNNSDAIIFNFFNSNNLKNIAELYNIPLFRQKEELEKINYSINFKLENFKIQNKSNEETEIDTSKDAVWQSEIAFMLLYTFYKKKFEIELIEEQQKDVVNINPFADNPLDEIPISLVTFRADKFASTLRPNFYEEYNNIKYILRLFYEIEAREKVSIYSIWKGLKLITPKADAIKDYSKKKAVIRQVRGVVLNNVLKGKTIVQQFEKLFFDSFKYLMDSNAHPGYRSYKKLLIFLLIYEKSINFGNIKNMNAELQQKAVNLGKSVGIKIIEFEGGDKKANAKNGRKYIIRLHKARTQEQFTEALIGVMKKYALSNKVIETIDKDNFILMRQYTVIGALNVINGFLSFSKNND